MTRRVTLDKNPASFSDEIIDALRILIPRHVPSGHVVHDPFAGDGVKLGALCDELGYEFLGTDLEWWRGRDYRVITGDSTDDGTYPAGPFVVATSPCLAHGERVLRDDLRWVPAEEIEVGDRLVAFDESPALRSNGRRGRRKWQLADVLHSRPQDEECVRVHLANGESVVCTLNHPWLADRYESGGNQLYARGQWIEARDLRGWWVYRQLDTWEPSTSYDAGWLAGIADGEGCLASGDRTSLKLQITQNEGVVLDAIQERMKRLGYAHSLYSKPQISNGRGAVVFLDGGLPQVMKALGELRPERLLRKWATFDLWGKKVIQSPKVQVVAVEPVGVRTIQALTTSTGTYIGEGYLHHNTYNNGVNDHFAPKDSSRRLTYRVAAGYPLHPNNTGRYSGRGSTAAEIMYWRITRAVVAHWPDRVLVNVKDSYRGRVLYPFVGMWRTVLRENGYRVKTKDVACPGWRFGENGHARATTEAILIGTKDRSTVKS